MMIARRHIDARFGHKQTVIDSMKTWSQDIASQIGWAKDMLRIASGSIGALEFTVEMDVLVQDLSELNPSWNKLGSIPAHRNGASKSSLHRLRYAAVGSFPDRGMTCPRIAACHPTK
jgi:hypothetical protein